MLTILEMHLTFVSLLPGFASLDSCPLSLVFHLESSSLLYGASGVGLRSTEVLRVRDDGVA